MTYLITYLRNDDVHCHEWIAPSNWSTAAVRRSFAQQFSGARIISITRS